MRWNKFFNAKVIIFLLLLLGGVGLLFLFNSDYVDIPRVGGMKRHHRAFLQDIPAPYNGLVNPLRNDSLTIKSGETIYQTLCSTCHGSNGIGDGPQAANLRYPPANLAHLLNMPVSNDAYLFWAISEGGVEFDTQMPAFDKLLSPEKRWQVISYLQTLR